MARKAMHFRMPPEVETARTEADEHGFYIDFKPHSEDKTFVIEEALHVKIPTHVALMLIGSLIRAHYGHHVELRWQLRCADDEEWLALQEIDDAALQASLAAATTGLST